MPGDIVIIRIYCHRCKSLELHVFNPVGSFSCLNCRALGFSTFRALWATCSIEDDFETPPK